MKTKKIMIAGSGMIGAGLAANALLHGYPTAIYSAVADPATARARIADVLARLAESGMTDEAGVNAALDLGVFTNDLAEAVEDAALVQECSPERLDVKQSLYCRVQELAGVGPVIASSTSAIMPTVLQDGVPHPERILVGHPYNPSYLLPLIEVCGGKQTSEETVAEAMAIYVGLGKKPVLCKKEVIGFLVNQISWSVMEIAKKLVMDGVCSVEDMDQAIMYGPGMRMAVTGQILTMSLGIQGGLRSAAAKYGKEPEPADLILADGVDAELAGRAPEYGNTEESVIRFRDKMFAIMLREQGIL